MLKTIIILLNCWNLADQLKFILKLLDQDAIKMELWDPTEIIAVPFPEDILQYFVFKSFASGIIISTMLNVLEAQPLSNKMAKANGINAITAIVVNVPGYALSSTLLQLFLAVVIFFLSILMGAPLWIWLRQTALASLYVSSLAFGFIQSKPSIVDMSKPVNANITSFEEIVSYIKLFLHPVIHIMTGSDKVFPSAAGGQESASTKIPKGSNLGPCDWTTFDQINRCILYSTFIITIPFMILNVLDHGDQKQRWPVPILLGSTLGHVVGVGIGIVSAWVSTVVQSVRHRMREKLRLA